MENMRKCLIKSNTSLIKNVIYQMFTITTTWKPVLIQMMKTQVKTLDPFSILVITNLIRAW